MKVSFPLLGFSWQGLSVGASGDGCGFLSSSFLNNSGCLGLSGLNLTKSSGGGRSSWSWWSGTRSWNRSWSWSWTKIILKQSNYLRFSHTRITS